MSETETKPAPTLETAQEEHRRAAVRLAEAREEASRRHTQLLDAQMAGSKAAGAVNDAKTAYDCRSQQIYFLQLASMTETGTSRHAEYTSMADAALRAAAIYEKDAR